MRLTVTVVFLMLSALTLAARHNQTHPGTVVLGGSPIPMCPHINCPPPTQ